MDYSKAVMSLLFKLQGNDIIITHVWDGGETFSLKGNNLAIRKEATDVINSVDSSVLRVTYGDESAKLSIILGNSEAEILQDWSCNPNGKLWELLESVGDDFSNQWDK